MIGMYDILANKPKGAFASFIICSDERNGVDSQVMIVFVRGEDRGKQFPLFMAESANLSLCPWLPDGPKLMG